MVELRSPKPQVGGSSPSSPAKIPSNATALGGILISELERRVKKRYKNKRVADCNTL